jgi:hypothetical protein
MRRPRPAALLPGLVAACCFLSPVQATAQASLTGQWTKTPNLPIVPIHNVLLPNGKVMMWGKNLGQTLWDPVTNSASALPSAGYDLFCAGHAYLADGRVLVAGGHIADYVGLANTSIYNPATNSWSRVPNMNAGRWYPTVTTLPNGDALVVSGQIDTSVGINPLPQVYQAATNTWRNLTSAQLNQPMYPMMFVAPNGKLVDVAPTNFTRYLDTNGTGAWSAIGWRKYQWRDYASGVMYDTGKILLVGGGDPPIAAAEVLDLNVAAPAWRAVPSMRVARRHVNATLLPDGTVLATGGTSGRGHNNTTTPVFSAELWNPATETWTTLASGSVPRLYHSSALLLPDGRVLVNGGDGYRDVEIFSPPYLFKGTRPTMSGVPGAIGYGQRFTVQSPNASDIRKVTLIRLAAVTHAFDENQRMNVLQFTPGTGTVNITAPANANLAPPGHYMLFVVNSAGVPSMASFVQLGGATPTPPPPAPAPALSSISPNGATAGGPAFTLTVNGSNFVSGAAVRWNGAARSTTFVGATQLRAAIPSTDIAAAGTANVSVANPDGSVSGTIPFSVSGPAATMATLTLAKNGTAPSAGTVTSNPAGINCGGTCSATFATGATVTLSAAAGSGGVFAGWSGACTGTGACTVSMNGAKAVTATFNTASAACYPEWNSTTRYMPGDKVTRLGKFYVATALSASVWNVNSHPEWTPDYWDPTTCGASTTPSTLTVSKNGTAPSAGTITSNPAGINCGGTCSAAFASGAAVTLSAAAGSGGVFAGWGGACTGTGACTLTMNANNAVTATFNTASGGACVPYPEWNSTTRYFPGNKVTRLGKYYVATELSASVWNVNSAPEWTPNYWALTTCP